MAPNTFSAILTSILVATASGFGAVVETAFSDTSSQGFFNSDISATDLINEGQPSVLSYNSSVGPNADAGTGLSGIYNGSAINDNLSNPGTLTYFGSTQFGSTLNSNPQLTILFNLDDNTGGSSTGYTLTSIQSIYGWRDFASMSDQHFSISISTDPDQIVFTPFYTVNYAPFDPSGDKSQNQPTTTKVVLTNLDLVGVTAIQFTFSPYNNGSINQAGQLIREIDVFGTATVVPEPGSIALLTTGFLAFVVRRRRR